MERELKPDVFLLDDGFQHFRLQRDRNIVLIDALDPLGGGVFPLGRLREPFCSAGPSHGGRHYPRRESPRGNRAADPAIQSACANFPGA